MKNDEKWDRKLIKKTNCFWLSYVVFLSSGSSFSAVRWDYTQSPFYCSSSISSLFAVRQNHKQSPCFCSSSISTFPFVTLDHTHVPFASERHLMAREVPISVHRGFLVYLWQYLISHKVQFSVHLGCLLSLWQYCGNTWSHTKSSSLFIVVVLFLCDNTWTQKSSSLFILVILFPCGNIVATRDHTQSPVLCSSWLSCFLVIIRDHTQSPFAADRELLVSPCKCLMTHTSHFLSVVGFLSWRIF